MGAGEIRDWDSRGIRKSGNREIRDRGIRRDCRGNPEIVAPGSRQGFMGGGPLDSSGAFSGVSVARFRGGFWRKRGPEIDHLRRPAGARVLGSPRPQIARFRAGAKICNFLRHS